jgi:hypothetical protein
MDTISTRPSLWFAFLAGPAAWTLHELLSYALVKLACETGAGFVLHLVSLLTLALAVAGAFAAVRIYQRESAPDARFLAAASGLMSGLFCFAILMEYLPDLAVSPCL